MNRFLKILITILILCLYTHNFSYAYEFENAVSNKEHIYRNSSTSVYAINPGVYDAAGNNYPGYRGTNQLIIYTPEYGKKTGTNEFGTEAIVINGYVTSISGADSLIPYNGFVISGHGRAKEWINQNVTIGAKIVVDPYLKTITSYITPESYIFEANEKIKEIFSIMKYYAYRNIPYDYTTSVDYLQKSRKSLMQAVRAKEVSKKYSTAAIESADTAIENAIPYYEHELKGVWIRPTEKNKKEIENTLDKLKDAGINTIFLETYYHSKTIYPSNVLERYGLTNQRQEFVGFDPLMIWITEAHKRKMKLNVWFESFYVGNDNPSYMPLHILNVYPQWANTTKEKYAQKGPVSSLTEHNGYFLDPANPRVQDFLLAIIDEILTKYQPDGINLDYIRYPQTVDKASFNYENANWGYTQYARDDFKSQYGIDPVDIKKGTQEWNIWAKYRQNKVTDFVRQVNEMINKKNYRTKLTAVIFPDRQRSLDTKMQDWRTWSYQNYVNGFTPLLLSCDYATAKSLLQDIKNNSNPFTEVYAGIFVSFMNGSKDDMLRQIHMTRQLDAKGVVIFDYSHFAKTYMDAVSQSAFTPLSDKTMKKINTGEISNLKLQNYLDKAIKDFYMEEMVINQALNQKQEQRKLQTNNFENNFEKVNKTNVNYQKKEIILSPELQQGRKKDAKSNSL